MKKEMEVELKTVNFKCIACQNVYNLVSTLSVDEYTIDVCSNCHPFYLGTTGVHQIKGRAEKLMGKFNAGKAAATTKKETTVKAEDASKQKKILTSLDNL